MGEESVDVGAKVSFAQQMVSRALSRMPEELSVGRPWGPWDATITPSASDPLQANVTLNIQLVGGGNAVKARCLLVRVSEEAEWELGFCAITVGEERQSYDFYGSLQDSGGGLYLGVYAVCMGCGDPAITRAVHDLDWVANDTDLPSRAEECDIPPLPGEDGAFVVNLWSAGMQVFVNEGQRSVRVASWPGEVRLAYSAGEGDNVTGFVIQFRSGGRPAIFAETRPSGPCAAVVEIEQATRMLRKVLNDN